jgi:hypothetical protein
MFVLLFHLEYCIRQTYAHPIFQCTYRLRTNANILNTEIFKCERDHASKKSKIKEEREYSPEL